MPPLIECHAHALPDAALARYPGGTSARYVTAERRVLGRMLEAHDAYGVTHALVSDSFFMALAAEELPSWAPTDRARLYNDHLADLLGRLPLSAADREAVRWRNAARLFGLEPGVRSDQVV